MRVIFDAHQVVLIPENADERTELRRWRRKHSGQAMVVRAEAGSRRNPLAVEPIA